MLKRHQKLSLFGLLICSFFAFWGTNSVFAEEKTGIHLQMAPSIQDMELDPGAVYENNFTITNNGSSTLEYKININPYSVNDIDYAPIYSVKNAYTQITDWITIESGQEEGTLEPNHSEIINYTITVPKDVPGGGQYAVIFAEAKDISNGDSIQDSARIGLIISARVSGDTRISGEIKDIKAPKFLLNPPVSASAVFTNNGNIDMSARMSLKIENYFSGQVIYDGTSDPVEKKLLPNTERELSVSWNNVPRLGVLRATLVTELPEANDANTKVYTIIVCPIWFIAIIALIFIAIIFRIISGKNENRHTRNNSKNNQGSSEKFNIQG
ncbi:hypothetical protein IKF63_00330 [Candidatus Saccharibacteria bacterium]|nr:hypothetical protein [Candidatus Saccharibacteria bacterium]